MEKSKFSRRDFLKLLSILPISAQLGIHQKFNRLRHPNPAGKNLPNIIIIVFDAFSATNMSLYGYKRPTTPHLIQLADQANIYHNHHSSANFTIPGTASILTGTYPWSHRAFNLEGTVTRDFYDQNIFELSAQQGYYTTAFSQNKYSEWLLHQFKSSINDLLDGPNFHLLDQGLNPTWFSNDFPLADQAKYLYTPVSSPTSFFNLLFQTANMWYSNRYESLSKELKDEFPRGMPETLGHKTTFRLEDVVDGIVDHIKTIPQPFLGYFHFWPPHEDYKTRREFIDIFQDEIGFPDKPKNFFTTGISNDKLKKHRRFYDEYIPYVDSEFNRFFKILKDGGILDNTYLILTSDHGEMFERGYFGHITEMLYQPVIKVPLMIFSPGQTERRDFYENTSSVDLLPTLLNLAEQKPPDWFEGNILPGFVNPLENTRSIYAMDVKHNSKFQPITIATFTIIRENFKLIYYMGYQDYEEIFELYDLENDPEELENIFDAGSSIAQELKTDLLAQIAAANV